MTERRTKEAIRYLGYGQHAVDKTTLAMIDRSFIELESCADKRSVSVSDTHLFAIDVGRGQLDWKLRQDERVICMEKTNIRNVVPEDIGEPIDFSSIDVSFISLTKVLLPIRNYLKEDGEIVALIKPQFEAGREKVGKKGVVREKSTHIEVIDKVISYAVSIGFFAKALEFSPIKGPEGNIEYLVHLQKCPDDVAGVSEDIQVTAVVEDAFSTLTKKE